MKLLPDWRRLVVHAWSIRLIVLAGLLSGAEAALPMISDLFPPRLFALLTMATIAGAFVARLVAQPKTLGDR